MTRSPDLLVSVNEHTRVERNRALFGWILASLCFLGGLWNCWQFCYAPDTDEIQYLNIGEAFLRGDGRHFLNSTWGPLFGLVSALWLRLTPNGYSREALKILNLCVLLLVLLGATAISNRIVRAHRNRLSAESFAITVFFTFSVLWICLAIMGVFRETPDLMLTAVLLGSAVCYLRLFDEANNSKYIPALAVGALGAAGYYLKQSYLPVAILYLAALAWPVARPRIRLLRVAVASAAFLILIGPWIASLSAAEGQLTLGGNSKFNYFVNVEHSDPIASVFNVLPPQDRLSSDPSVVDFGATFPHAQFPLHFDGAYYLKGVPIQFRWSQQVKTSLANYVITLNLFRHKGPFAVALVLGIMAGLCLRKPSLSSPWLPLMAISAAPFILYPLVHVEYRYLAPYLFLGAISAWAWVTLQNPNVSRTWALLLGCCLAGGILWDTASDLRAAKAEGGAVSFACCENPYAKFRNELHAAGVPDGAKIALVGEPRAEHFYSWLNPGDYRLQAVITDPGRFFAEPAALREKTERELSDRGSRLLLAPHELVPRGQAEAWHATKLGYSFQLLGDASAQTSGAFVTTR